MACHILLSPFESVVEANMTMLWALNCSHPTRPFGLTPCKVSYLKLPSQRKPDYLPAVLVVTMSVHCLLCFAEVIEIYLCEPWHTSRLSTSNVFYNSVVEHTASKTHTEVAYRMYVLWTLSQLVKLKDVGWINNLSPMAICSHGGRAKERQYV